MIYKLWRSDNGGWIIHAINTPMSGNRMPFTQRKLLRNIIESADTALMSATPSANLRYGHDGILINLVTLMDINGLGQEFRHPRRLRPPTSGIAYTTDIY